MTSLRPPKGIIFDWDNTLVDTWDCIHDALNATLRHMGHAEWSLDETRQRVALSARDAFPLLFGDRWQEAQDVFYASFRAVHIARLRPLEGAGEMLESLAGQGIWLAVVSNKNGDLLRKEARHLGWDRFFKRLVGATDAAQDKPALAPVLMALDGSGQLPGQDIWFVGDAPVDMHCAVAAGCLPLLLRREPPDSSEFSDCMPMRHLLACADLAGLVGEVAVPISDK